MGTKEMLQYEYVLAKLSLNIKSLNLINKDITQYVAYSLHVLSFSNKTPEITCINLNLYMI